MLNLFMTKIKTIKCNVPQQTNNYDCGVYVLKFTMMILDVKPLTTLDYSKLLKTAFTQAAVDSERQNIKDLIKR
jgi:Ulp1 family protease